MNDVHVKNVKENFVPVKKHIFRVTMRFEFGNDESNVFFENRERFSIWMKFWAE